MTDRKTKKLSYEILGLIGIATVFSWLLFFLLSGIATAVAENYCFYNDIPMTELEWIPVDRMIFTVSVIIAGISFSILFLLLLNDRITYIRVITEGIAQLHTGCQKLSLPLLGNNELTELAEAINVMSESQFAIREKEQQLAQEKEQLIRTLSHDIRTPLTSILSYSEYFNMRGNITLDEQKAYVNLISKKAEQIRDLTDILLEGGRRCPEYFEDAKLLMEQLLMEFEETLEDNFEIHLDMSKCSAFSGSFDVSELRRIFDNLSSNIQKYADPTNPIILSVGIESGHLLIRQSNSIGQSEFQSESFQIGLNSIRRIIQYYGGQVHVDEGKEKFSIEIFIPL